MGVFHILSNVALFEAQDCFSSLAEMSENTILLCAAPASKYSEGLKTDKTQSDTELGT